MSLYLQAFLECIGQASIFPFISDTTYYAMQAFGGYNMGVAYALAVTGAVIGHAFNWWVGRLVLYFEHKGKFHINAHYYERFRHLFARYGIWLLLFSWAPMFKFLTVAAGFFNIRPRLTLTLIALGQATYYGRVFIPA